MGNKYLVLETFQYKHIVVNEGFITNGADIPRVFWSFSPPFKPKYLPAVVLHDYLCELGDFAYADKIFEEVLLLIEDSFSTKIIIKSVKLYNQQFKGRY
ncbi:MAG: DUF1353 domain-containing protein [Bacteroidota bacterium]|nr:DUF1353 domain-containing protein [Bacteroidota bacterium]